MGERRFDETADAVVQTYAAPRPRKGFFTDTTLCIGCKACEVACKEWNQIPEDGMTFSAESYDNTGALGGDTWRHVAFIEQIERSGRWLMSSDVCKHCTSAACLDVCPTGALFRTEFGTVVVQDDVCNGCGYCVPACPFGVIDRRKDVRHVGKCTLCYDRLKGGEMPACAKACPTESIQYGDLDELHERARKRLDRAQADYAHAQLYGVDSEDGVGGLGAFFLLLDKPEIYGLPPDPVVTTRDLPAMWKTAGIAAATLGTMIFAAAFAGRR